jgi:hypothetical protein
MHYGGVTQTISTTIGTQYTLSFSVGSDQSNPIYSGPVSVTASVGSGVQTFTFTAPTGSVGDQWGEFSLGFTATSTSTVVTLIGNTTAGGQDISLDNVSVTGALEPSQTAALGLGVLGLSVLALKARRRVHIS